MTQDDIRKALKNKSDKLDIISLVTGVSEARLKKIIKGSEMTTFEFSTLTVNA